MGSHVERHQQFETARCSSAAVQSLCVDAGDTEEGWSGVKLALAYVDRMVCGLADITDDADLRAADDVTDCSGQLRTASRSSLQLTDNSDEQDARDDDAGRCINDACEML